jgi:hypothetical protein
LILLAKERNEKEVACIPEREDKVLQFEYRVVRANELSEDLLNNLGQEGWELVCSAQSIMYGSCLVLKRPKQRRD